MRDTKTVRHRNNYENKNNRKLMGTRTASEMKTSHTVGTREHQVFIYHEYSTTETQKLYVISSSARTNTSKLPDYGRSLDQDYQPASTTACTSTYEYNEIIRISYEYDHLDV